MCRRMAQGVHATGGGSRGSRGSETGLLRYKYLDNQQAGCMGLQGPRYKYPDSQQAGCRANQGQPDPRHRPIRYNAATSLHCLPNFVVSLCPQTSRSIPWHLACVGSAVGAQRPVISTQENVTPPKTQMFNWPGHTPPRCYKCKLLKKPAVQLALTPAVRAQVRAKPR